MFKALFQEHRLNVNHFFDHIDYGKVEEIFDLFRNCSGKPIFTGVGKSGIIADKLSKTMLSTGTVALWLPPMDALHGDIGLLGKGDLLICISKSGESEELLNLIPFARKRGATTVAWVSSTDCRLLDACDAGICLPVYRELCPFDLVPTTSAAVQLLFGDVLAMALMKAKQFGIDEYALNHPGGKIGREIALRVRDIMLQGDRLPLCNPNEPLKKALIELTNKRCGCLLIVDEEHTLRGIFTDGDLRRAVQKEPERVLSKTMDELMQRNFLFIEGNPLLREALNLMQANEAKKVMMLPVLQEDKLIGLVHMHDIVRGKG
ncbi:MAG: KpsF/GutQ family sugar-phosphate isomerase [Simkaniaceae bacterium]|nr:KpsF/GutQ family sugar-phosphate isomerase [Simkaniaceae bacterium]